MIGPGDAKCWGLNPRFEEVTQHYVDYPDQRAVPQISPTKLYANLGKRDSMHFDSAGETTTAVKWPYMASVIQPEAETLIQTLRSSGIPPARRVPEATPVSSDEDDRKEARQVHFHLPPVEAAENPIVASASNKIKHNLWAEQSI